MLVICPLSMAAIFAYVTAGLAPGLDAGHPTEYLQITCVLWALIMTVIPILRLMRVVSLPLWFTILVYANMYLYVISLCQGMYMNIRWWGDLTHILSSLVVASFVFIALCLMESHSPSLVTFGSERGLLCMLFLVSLSFGGIWEMMEGFTDAVAGQSFMVYGATDTLADLAADLIGALVMVVIAGSILRKQDAVSVASKIRLGRNAIDVDSND